MLVSRSNNLLWPGAAAMHAEACFPCTPVMQCNRLMVSTIRSCSTLAHDLLSLWSYLNISWCMGGLHSHVCWRAKRATRHGLPLMHAAQGLLIEIEWLGCGPSSCSTLWTQTSLGGRPMHPPPQVFIQRLHSVEQRR